MRLVNKCFSDLSLIEAVRQLVWLVLLKFCVDQSWPSAVFLILLHIHRLAAGIKRRRIELVFNKDEKMKAALIYLIRKDFMILVNNRSLSFSRRIHEKHLNLA